LTILVVGPLAFRASVHARDVASPNTSTMARWWILANVPAGSGILTEVYGPPLPSGNFNVFTIDQQGSVITAERIIGDAYPQWNIGRIKDPVEVANQRIRYVVISDRERYLAESHKYAKAHEAYDTVIGPGRLVFEISQGAGARRGPKIQIFD